MYYHLVAIDLTSPEAEFAFSWLSNHVKIEPEESPNLTWYVAAGRFYTDYVNSSNRDNLRALDFGGLYAILRMFHPGIGTGRLSRQPVYTRIRYYPNGFSSPFWLGV